VVTSIRLEGRIEIFEPLDVGLYQGGKAKLGPVTEIALHNLFQKKGEALMEMSPLNWLGRVAMALQFGLKEGHD